MSSERVSPLANIIALARNLATDFPEAAQLAREITLAAAQIRLGSTARPIASAPRNGERSLLLYCAKQGGWHTGEWFQGEWTDTLTRGKSLEPTHWTELPEPPQD